MKFNLIALPFVILTLFMGGLIYYRYEVTFLKDIPAGPRRTFRFANWSLNLLILLVLFLFLFDVYKLGPVYQILLLLTMLALIILALFNLAIRSIYMNKYYWVKRSQLERLRRELDTVLPPHPAGPSAAYPKEEEDDHSSPGS